ncbi:MAG TPA: TIGR04551 family protein, partial [Polyangia bacterium]
MSPKAGSLRLRLAIGLPLTLALAGASPAWAQMGGMSPGMGPGMGKPGGMSPHEEKEEGPAEVAPDAEEKAPASKESDTSQLEQARRRTKVVEFDGYYRMRTDYLYKMNMGQGYNPGGSGGGPPALPPFPVPSECLPSGQVGNSGTPSSGGVTGACDNGLGSGNMRLRIEPTINISDQVRVRSQFDIFDNLILGSTPDSLVNPYIPHQNQYSTPVGQTTAAAPTDALSNTQNSYVGSILAKRAWGEIDSEYGSLRFGRMPWHFGRGMYFNRGDCADCDGGTTVDRFMVLTTIYGHQLALAMDFGAQGYHIGYTDLGQNNTGGFPLDLSQKDDVNQYMASITKIDDDKTWNERVAAGDVMVNYGAQLVYRSQDYATFNISSSTGSAYSTNSQAALSSTDVGNSITTNVNALLFIPSLWFKLGWKALTVEFEGNMLAGKMGDAGPLRLDITSDKGLTILQAGWVLASQLKLYNDSLFVGFETGGATGDQAELAYGPNSMSGGSNSLYYPYLNYRWKFVPQPRGDRNLNDFHFSPEYHVDEILFRRILGTVTNAIYFKPS